MFTIPSSPSSEIPNSVKNLILLSLSSGMETPIRNATSGFSTFLEEKKDGKNADGILMMKVYLGSGDSPKSLINKFATLLKPTSMARVHS